MFFSASAVVVAAVAAACAASMPYSSYYEQTPRMPSPFQEPARMPYTPRFDPAYAPPPYPQYGRMSRTPYAPRYEPAPYAPPYVPAPYAPRTEPASRFLSLPSIPFFGGGGGPDYSGYAWAPLAHDVSPTQYVQWKYGTSNVAEGLTYGVQCKGRSCEDRSAFTTRPGDERPLRATHAVHTRWTRRGESSQVFCPRDSFVSRVECKDVMCERARLVCAPLSKMFRAVYKPRVVSTFDGDARAYCPPGKYMDGFWCLNDCNTFYLTCTEVEHFRPS